MTTLIPDTSLGDDAATGGTGAFPVVVASSFLGTLKVVNNLKFFILTNIGPMTIDIPDNAAEAFPIGAEMVFLRNTATGTITFAVTGVAVLQSRNGLISIKDQYSTVTLKKNAIDEWRLFGDLA